MTKIIVENTKTNTQKHHHYPPPQLNGAGDKSHHP